MEENNLKLLIKTMIQNVHCLIWPSNFNSTQDVEQEMTGQLRTFTNELLDRQISCVIRC